MTILNLQVAANADDCARRLTASYFDAAYLNNLVGNYDAANKQWGCGMRFVNVTVPKDYLIETAYLTFTCIDTHFGTTCRSKISGELVANDNPGDFSGDDAASFDARFANHTIAIEAWEVPTWPTDGAEYISCEIKAVIQELINRANWASGQALVLFWEDFDDLSDAAAKRIAYSHNRDSAKAPKLHIEYTAIAGRSFGFIIG